MVRDTTGLRRRGLMRFSYWLGVIFGVTMVALLAGIGVAAALAERGGAEAWSRWSDVGQTFGALSSVISGLALVAVVVTARVQFRELQRSAAADLSMLHLEILKMSINDPELAKVWPEYRSGLSVTDSRQFLYANIIYQFHWTSLELNRATEEEVLRSMRYLFTNQIMRRYWVAAVRARESLDPVSAEYAFARRVDEICRDYEIAVAAERGSRRRATVRTPGSAGLAEEPA